MKIENNLIKILQLRSYVESIKLKLMHGYVTDDLLPKALYLCNAFVFAHNELVKDNFTRLKYPFEEKWFKGCI